MRIGQASAKKAFDGPDPTEAHRPAHPVSMPARSPGSQSAVETAACSVRPDDLSNPRPHQE
jgi:hypothetical protein